MDHVLIVEDEAQLRQRLVRSLQQDGTRIHAAGTAVEAMRVLDRVAVDVLVVDIRLPDQANGLDLAEISTIDNLWWSLLARRPAGR